MALYIPHSIFHLARLLYVRPETFGPYYVQYHLNVTFLIIEVLSHTKFAKTGMIRSLACHTTCISVNCLL